MAGDRRSAWESAYRGSPPPWDIARPQQAVIRLARAGGFRGRVLDAGCGTGENAMEIAARGLATWGVDLASTAIAEARRKAESRGLNVNFAVADALDLASLGLMFDSVLDCGLFHTFEDDDRAAYVESLASVVVTGGVLHLMCFSDLEPWGGGPRRVSQAEIRASFVDRWQVASIEPERFETRLHPEGARAWLARIERL